MSADISMLHYDDILSLASHRVKESWWAQDAHHSFTQERRTPGRKPSVSNLYRRQFSILERGELWEAIWDLFRGCSRLLPSRWTNFRISPRPLELRIWGWLYYTISHLTGMKVVHGFYTPLNGVDHILYLHRWGMKTDQYTIWTKGDGFTPWTKLSRRERIRKGYPKCLRANHISHNHALTYHLNEWELTYLINTLTYIIHYGRLDLWHGLGYQLKWIDTNGWLSYKTLIYSRIAKLPHEMNVTQD